MRSPAGWSAAQRELRGLRAHSAPEPHYFVLRNEFGQGRSFGTNASFESPIRGKGDQGAGRVRQEGELCVAWP